MQELRGAIEVGGLAGTAAGLLEQRKLL